MTFIYRIRHAECKKNKHLNSRTFLEDLKKVERFMQYIENQGSENYTEIAESQE